MGASFDCVIILNFKNTAVQGSFRTTKNILVMKKERSTFFLSEIGECILDNSERHHRNLGAVQPRTNPFFSIV